LVNPLTGKEDEYDLSPVSEPRRVVVVGGGVSGCEAALVAARRGHTVTLLESSQELGGQWLAAAAPLAKGDFTSFVAWQQRQLEQLGVEVLLGVEATRETIDGLAPDAVILAVGSRPAMPPIPGLREYGVVAQDILRGRAEFDNRVVVIGGGLVGAETADFVAEGGSSDVTIVEMLDQIVRDGEPAPTSFLLERLAAHGVNVLTSAAVKSVEADAVVYEKSGDQVRLGDVDTVIVAIGARANTNLAGTLADAPYQVVSVGDCNERAKNGYRGIQEGFEAGLRV
jgi:pyruvate/2-oxoglutarate dehydrogenase complex dihydrolipoamide dehydrogenase (E3) component